MNILNKSLSLLALFLLIYFNYAVFIKQYYDLRRLLIIYRKRLKSWVKSSRCLTFFLICGCAVFWGFIFGKEWGILYFNIYLILVACSFNQEKVVFTRRSISQLSVIIILLVTLGGLFLNSDTLYLIMMPLLFTFPFLLIGLSYYLEVPVELFVRHYYIASAKKKLRLNPELIIIAITGSFGKTSFKKSLFILLNEKYRVIKSPGSVNTLMGLTKFINDELTPYEEIVIFECGVDKPRGMEKLLKLFTPDIAIITAVGEMHLATFKKLENIKKEKLKLAKAVRDKRKVFYLENPHLSKDDFAGEAVGYSLTQKCLITPKGSTINIIYQGKPLEMTINLYGHHQIENVLGAIKVAESLKLSYQEIVRGLAKLHPEPQRLSLRKIQERYILDDAYNSNQKGLLEAIHVLKQFPGPRAIITPGVIELDSAYHRINHLIGEHLVDLDIVYIISKDEKQVHPLLQGYLSNDGNPQQVFVKNNFLEAYQDSLHHDIKSLLIANDTSKTFIK